MQFPAEENLSAFGAFKDEMRRERQRVRIIDGQRGVMQGGAFYPNAEDVAEPVPSIGAKTRRYLYTRGACTEQRRQKLREFVEGGAKAQEGVSSVETLQNVKWLNVLALKRVKCLLDARWFLPSSRRCTRDPSKDLSSLNLL